MRCTPAVAALSCLLTALVMQWVLRRRELWLLSAAGLEQLDSHLADSDWDGAYVAWMRIVQASPGACEAVASERIARLESAALGHQHAGEAMLEALQRTTLRSAAVFAGTAVAEQTLLRALKERHLSALAEGLLWDYWFRSGDAGVDAALRRGIEQTHRQETADALKTFSELTRSHPWFAEGWNRRATLRFQLGWHAESLADCEEVLARAPGHFGALHGSGLVHLAMWQAAQTARHEQRQGESIVAVHHRALSEEAAAARHLRAAHEAFAATLDVHPHLEAARRNLRHVQALLGKGEGSV